MSSLSRFPRDLTEVQRDLQDTVAHLNEPAVANVTRKLLNQLRLLVEEADRIVADEADEEE